MKKAKQIAKLIATHALVGLVVWVVAVQSIKGAMGLKPIACLEHKIVRSVSAHQVCLPPAENCQDGCDPCYCSWYVCLFWFCPPRNCA